MANYQILTDPDPRLRVRSEPVALEALTTPKFRAWLPDLVTAMREDNGIGIAAPQIGILERVIVIDFPDGPQIYINPEITYRSVSKIETEEGCLSVPGVFGLVKRAKKIRIKALTTSGEKIRLEAKGQLAVVFQHEIDHLDGILFIDKVTKFTNPPRL